MRKSSHKKGWNCRTYFQLIFIFYPNLIYAFWITNKCRGYMEARGNLHKETLVSSTFCRSKIHWPKKWQSSLGSQPHLLHPWLTWNLCINVNLKNLQPPEQVLSRGSRGDALSEQLQETNSRFIAISVQREEARLFRGDALEQHQSFCCKGMGGNRTGHADIL